MSQRTDWTDKEQVIALARRIIAADPKVRRQYVIQYPGKNTFTIAGNIVLAKRDGAKVIWDSEGDVPPQTP